MHALCTRCKNLANDPTPIFGYLSVMTCNINGMRIKVKKGNKLSAKGAAKFATNVAGRLASQDPVNCPRPQKIAHGPGKLSQAPINCRGPQ